MKYYIFLFIFLFSFLKAEYLVYEDKDNTATIQFVKNNQNKLFTKTNKSSLGATQSTVWLKIILKNNEKSSSYKYIRFREAFLYNVELYEDDLIFQGGSLVPLKDRELNFVNDTFRVLVPIEESKTIYVKIQPKYNATYAYDIFDSKDELISYQNLFDSIFQSYISVISLIGISGLILFIIFREKLFLYYVLFVFITASFQYFQTGRVLNFIHLPDIVKYDEISALLTIYAIALFLTTLFEEFKKNHPFFNNLFKLVFSSLLIGLLLLIIDFNFYIDLIVEVLIINFSLISILIFVLYLLIKRVKYSLFVFTGMMILIISSMFCALYYIGIIDNPYSLVLIQLSSLIEALAFLSLILYRIYNKISEEKQKSDKYANTLNDMQRLARMGTWSESIVTQKITIDNPTKEILEISTNEITIDDLKKIIHPEDFEKLMEVRSNSILNQSTTNALLHRIITPFGKVKYVSVHWQYKLDKQGELLNTEGYLVDVTEKVLAQKELENHQALLTHQQRLAQQGEMLSMIAHQWRQPLTAISATINNLLVKNLIGAKIDLNELNEELILVNDYAQHLSSTINDFRDFFKPDKDKEETTLEKLLDKSLSIIKTSIESNEIVLIKNYECNENIKTYSNEIQQVILNIIKNAQDVLIQNNIQEKKIFIKTKTKDGFAVLSISDNAGGIDESIINKIFEPYFSTKNNKEGTGLGLYMSKIIIDEHCNGKLTVKNDKQGAAFTIKLPLN